MEFGEEHIGKRVQYTDRNGKHKYGKIKGYSGPDRSRFIDLDLEGSWREHYFVPADACVLVPDELGDIKLT